MCGFGEEVMERMREARNGLLCAALAAQLILSPVLGAAVQAAGATPDPNAAADKRLSMEVAPNGVPVVNITAATVPACRITSITISTSTSRA